MSIGNKDKISFSSKKEPVIDIQPKGNSKFKKESIEILTTEEKLKRIWTLIKPIHLLAACLIIIGGGVLLALSQPPEPIEPGISDQQQPAVNFTFEQPIRSELPFIVEKQELQVDLIDAMVNNQKQLPFSWEVMSKLEEILSWSFGLRNLKKGDVVYCIRASNDQEMPGQEEIVGLALDVSALDTILMAIRFKANGKAVAYYDETACPVERQFLQSPVRYGRISSRFNLTRLNPVFGIIKPHKGTDFAALTGEPIFVLADGVVVEQGFTAGNGNYVKLRHDSIYATAYLHMSRFAANQRVGDSISQGAVIGYVGSTGHSTGPHVCLRFWRRGIQRDFVQQHPYLPAPPSLPYAERERFLARKDSILLAIKLFDN